MNKKPVKKSTAFDGVHIVAPASSLSDQEMGSLSSWVSKSIKQFEYLIGNVKTTFHSSEDTDRFEQLKKALTSKRNFLVWCTRGGYGSIRLIPRLLKLKKPQNHKWLLGYSDITSLHLFLHTQWNWKSIHGPLLETVSTGKIDPSDLILMYQALSGREKHLNYGELKPINEKAQKVKKLEGTMLGGNLLTFMSHAGTKIWPKKKNISYILFFEETGERGYRIDRWLEQLSQSGLLKQTKALLFADFLGGDERDGKNYVSYAVERFAAENQVACFSGLKCGHGHKQQLLFQGHKYQLNKKTQGIELSCENAIGSEQELFQ